jgi:hypothetical protein
MGIRFPVLMIAMDGFKTEAYGTIAQVTGSESGGKG